MPRDSGAAAGYSQQVRRQRADVQAMAVIDLQFLGEQMRRVQGDLREVRTEQLQLEADQAALRADLGRLDNKVDAGFAVIGANLVRVERELQALDHKVDQGFAAIDRMLEHDLPGPELRSKVRGLLERVRSGERDLYL